jgi:hypothetical protein
MFMRSNSAFVTSKSLACRLLFLVWTRLEGLFPEGGLRRGVTYEIDASASLLWTLLAAPTRQGVWCAVVGMPDVGVAAAEDMGVNLDSLILVPSPDHNGFLS